MIKQKGLKAIIISLLVILSTTCFSLLYSNIYKTFTKEEPQAAIGGYTITEDFNALANNYQKYSTFYISAGSFGVGPTIKNSFNTFLTFLNSPTYSVTSSNMVGETTSTFYTNDYFKNKTVYLSGNVSYDLNTSTNGSLIEEFAGIFDGNGYSITITETVFFNESNKGGNEGAFCDNLTGTIKDLMINAGVYIGTGSDTNTYGGIIAGKNSGTIENCIVNGGKFQSNRYAKNCHIAPIAGNNAGTIKNCMAIGTFSFDDHEDGDEGFNFYTFEASGTASTNCIYDANITDNIKDSSRLIQHEVGSGNYDSCSSAHGGMSSSVADNSTGSSGTAFYKYKTTNYGMYGEYCVFLRTFISWNYVYFDVENGSVDNSSIQVPSNYTEVTTGDNIAEVYGTIIRATPNSGYGNPTWSSNGNNYTCTFTNETYTINFAQPTINGTVINISPSPESITVKYGDTITINTNNYNLNYQIGNSSTIVYSTGSIYKVVSWGKLGSTTISNGVKVPDLGNNGASATITPEIQYATEMLTFSAVTGTDRTSPDSYTILRGRPVTASLSGGSAIYTFHTFNASDATESLITVTYTPNELYEITAHNYTAGLLTISPTIEQKFIYAQFAQGKDETGAIIGDVPSITTTAYLHSSITPGKYYIAKTDTNQLWVQLSNNVDTNNTLSCILHDTTIATYANIPLTYSFKEYHCNETTETIIYTPIMQESYIKVIFKQNDVVIAQGVMDKGTDVSAVSGYNNGWDNSTSTLYLNCPKDGVEQIKTFTFEISRITITIKTYGIIFG